MSSAPTFEHGTRDTYTFHGCRCDDCRKAQMRAVKAYRLATRADSRGRPTMHLTVDAEPARQHVAALRASGWTLAEIAREIGVGPDAIWQNINPSKQRIRRERAEALLALAPLEPVAVDRVVVERLVDAFPARTWDDLGATRAERIAAAEQLDARGRSLRPYLKGRGFGDQQVLAPGRNEIERCLTLRAGRDFAVRQEVAS